MTAFAERRDSVFVMERERRGDHRAIHRDMVEHGAIVLEPKRYFKFPLELGQLFRAQAIHCDDLAIAVRFQRRQMVDRRPPASADHSNARPSSHSGSAPWLGRLSLRFIS